MKGIDEAFKLGKLYRFRLFVEMQKLRLSEFFWRFHPDRNRFCDKCGELAGNSKSEMERHQCS